MTPELERMLEQVTCVVKDIRKHLNEECARIAEAWSAYLAEYVYSSTEAVTALKKGDKMAAAKHRLDATCHRARADRKHKELRRAIERFANESSQQD
jgi:hypothetical protein